MWWWLRWASWFHSSLISLSCVVLLKHISRRCCSYNEPTYASTTVVTLMPLAVSSYVACRICVLWYSHWVTVILNRLHKASRQRSKALGLVLKDLLALFLTEPLRASWGSPVCTWSTLPSHLVVQTCWPFTGLSLQEVVLAHNTVSVAKRGRLRDLQVAVPRSLYRSIVLLIHRGVMTTIINLALFLSTMVARIQRLTFFRWEQV